MDPFAPIPRAPTPGGSGAICPSCGSPFDPSTGTIDGQGRNVCRTCTAKAQSAAASQVMVAHDPTTARNLWGGAGISVLLGALTCCTSALGTWFFVVSFMPITTGAGVLWVLATQAKARETLGPSTIVVGLLAAAGMGLGLLGLAFGILIVTGAYREL